MTLIEIDRPAALDPTHGRPRVLALTGREGRLAVHIQRDDGSLWLFASGPKGGDRGKVVVATRVADKLAAWIADECADTFHYTGRGWITLRPGPDGDRTVVVGTSGLSRTWKMRLDPASLAILVECLHGWATAARSNES